MVDVNDLKRGYIFKGGTSIIIIKAVIIKRVLFDENLFSGEDWDLLLRLSRDFKVSYVPMALVDYNDGDHRRLSNEKKHMPPAQLEGRLRVVFKHQNFLGPYWTSYRCADILLSYITSRPNKLTHIRTVIQRFGLSPVLAVFYKKARKRVDALFV